jgi:hypothetical protein
MDTRLGALALCIAAAFPTPGPTRAPKPHPTPPPSPVLLIKTARKRNPGLQLLLFSATFNDNIKQYAIRIAPRANQVCARPPVLSPGPKPGALRWRPAARGPRVQRTTTPSPLPSPSPPSPSQPLTPQVFVPKENLSLDVIKQYNVV